ncbi:MAG: hypothetical protein HN849_33000, partial [Victivallales bacterium]|nr:hypothetical protein [Victivallales bacterium]
VAEFNRTVAAAPAPRGKAANPNVRTLETELARDKRTATQKGRPFNPEQTKRWFRAKDLNGDGILDERELRTKVRPDWNKVGK